MDSLTTQALSFEGGLFGPSIVAGVTTSGLYGLVAVALVLSYRISRTIAFVHGGIVLSGALLYWYFVTPTYSGGEDILAGLDDGGGGGGRPELPKWVAVFGLMLAGAAVAAFYGWIVTSTRMATYPRVTLTNFSLALMLIMVGIIFTKNKSSGEQAPSPFGGDGFEFPTPGGTVDQRVSYHQLATLIILVAVVIGFAILLQRTRFGVYTRAVADNVEASKLVGVPIGKVGTIVYAISGAIAALGGILIANPVGTETTGILFIFLRALIVCVLGAFASIPLALAGAVLIAVIDSMIESGVFGTPDKAVKEIVVVAILFSVVIGIDRFGKKSSSVLAGH
ncbi:branched-chain amino acid ABC transporter permease [Sporichthya polymorpha]|uniref:branched-chain amino acid ABC transporter permease n=1 Tax=Sporichthya polymorpha TaxID=35751 RepID=UPI00035FE3E1|nr:branched-chain amino acid ABC transporter permease [Sporichthya polymorpha]